MVVSEAVAAEGGKPSSSSTGLNNFFPTAKTAFTGISVPNMAKFAVAMVTLSFVFLLVLQCIERSVTMKRLIDIKVSVNYLKDMNTQELMLL